MAKDFIFTSESVSEGHPDKVADQISDALLDAILTRDPNPARARVACETMVKTGVVIVGGEITTDAWVDLDDLVRETVTDIGYTSSDVGFDGSTCAVMSLIGKQSGDIAMGVNRNAPEEQGAGDQGLMFGYATNETDVLMPAPITFAHRLVQRQSEMRKSHVLPWLRPDAKSQVTLRYQDGKVAAVDAVVLSTQHDPDVDYQHLREAVMENIILPVLPEEWIHGDTKFHINPTGSFIIGGPVGDCGLTGSKIIVDTVVVPFRARIHPRSTAPPPTPVATWPRISSPRASPNAARFRSPTPSALRILRPLRSRPSVPPKFRRNGSPVWFASISTCALTASSGCSI